MTGANFGEVVEKSSAAEQEKQIITCACVLSGAMLMTAFFLKMLPLRGSAVH